MITVYIGIGSNLERERHINAAVSELALLGESLRLSRVFEAEPVGFEGPNFYNLVAEFSTSLSLAALSEKLRAIELAWGRAPDAKKNQSRTLDLDILLYGDERRSEKPQLPRADIYKFAFTLWPLAELCPDKVIPGEKRTLAELWRAFEHNQQLWPVELPGNKG